jgi:DNA primase
VEIKDIINKISIEQVISSRIQIKKKGREFEALCPFHHEKTPSFTISPQKNFIIVLVVAPVVML